MNLDRPYLGCRVLGFALIVFAACPCLANGDAEDYERGMKALEESQRQRDFERRNELLGEAEAAFRVFLKESPEHPSACSARTQIGNILVERARMQLELARNTNGNGQAEARRLYEQAYENFETVRAKLKLVLSRFRGLGPADGEKLARRDRLRADYLQAQLLKAAVLEESADAYDSKDEKRQDVLVKAVGEYGEVFKKYRTRLAGLYARLYESRCLMKLGQYKEALERLDDLLTQPDNPAAFSTLKTKALNLAMGCWLDDSIKEYQQATARGDQWLKKSGDQKPESRDWLELRFHLARAHWLLIESLDDVPQRDAHREKARDLAEFVARRKGAFQADARKLLAEIGGDNAAAEPSEPKSFAEAKAAGREALDEIKEISMEVAVRGRLAAAVDAKSVPKPGPLQLKLKQKRAEALRHFQLALRLADHQTPKEDVDVVRYFLCYLHYADGAYQKAAEVGDEVARNRDATVGARQCAKIALASYLKVYLSQSPKGEKACDVVKRLEALANHILDTWPDEREAVEALDMLVSVLLREERVDDSVAYFQKMPPDSPRRNRTAMRLGTSLWRSHLLGVQRLRAWEQDGGPGPDTDVEAVKKQVAKTKEQAKAILSDAIHRARDSKDITQEVVTATLSLIQIYLESGGFERAIPLLEDPKIGPLTLVQGNHPATQRPFVAREIYKTAIRAYEGVGDEAKAKPLRKLLEESEDD